MSGPRDLTVAPDHSRRLHRIGAVADLLDVSTKTVYRLVESGDLEMVKIRGGSRVTAASLESYMARVTGGAA